MDITKQLENVKGSRTKGCKLKLRKGQALREFEIFLHRW